MKIALFALLKFLFHNHDITETVKTMYIYLLCQKGSQKLLCESEMCFSVLGAAMAEWLSSWLAEQEDWG